MNEYDEKVIQCFLEKQEQLFMKRVVETKEEAKEFLEDCMAVVVNSIEEVWEYFDEEGMDLEGMDEQEILEAEEVFKLGDGRFLIVVG